MGSASRRGRRATKRVGELMLDFPGGDATNYRRSLDLEHCRRHYDLHALATRRYTRQVFASAADQVLVVRLTADKPGRIDFKATFTTPYKERQDHRQRK